MKIEKIGACEDAGTPTHNIFSSAMMMTMFGAQPKLSQSVSAIVNDDVVTVVEYTELECACPEKDPSHNLVNDHTHKYKVTELDPRLFANAIVEAKGDLAATVMLLAFQDLMAKMEAALSVESADNDEPDADNMEAALSGDEDEHGAVSDDNMDEDVLEAPRVA